VSKYDLLNSRAEGLEAIVAARGLVGFCEGHWCEGCTGVDARPTTVRWHRLLPRWFHGQAVLIPQRTKAAILSCNQWLNSQQLPIIHPGLISTTHTRRKVKPKPVRGILLPVTLTNTIQDVLGCRRGLEGPTQGVKRKRGINIIKLCVF
jgi:hypothetical protein